MCITPLMINQAFLNQESLGRGRSRPSLLSVRRIVQRLFLTPGAPGLVDRPAGHYDLKARPTRDLDAFVGAIDDQVEHASGACQGGIADPAR